MPLFQVTLQKRLSTEFWTNDYYVETDDLGAAATVAVEIAQAERLLHLEVVQYDTCRVRTTVVGDEIYRNFPITLAGARPVGEYLPLFNVFTFNLVPDSGRNSLKYIRGPVLKADQVNGGIVDAFKTGPAANYISALNAIEELRDVDNQPIVGFSLKSQVGMRQLRRGSKRRTEPVIPAPGEP